MPSLLRLTKTAGDIKKSSVAIALLSAFVPVQEQLNLYEGLSQSLKVENVETYSYSPQTHARAGSEEFPQRGLAGPDERPTSGSAGLSLAVHRPIVSLPLAAPRGAPGPLPPRIRQRCFSLMAGDWQGVRAPHRQARRNRMTDGSECVRLFAVARDAGWGTDVARPTKA